MKREILLEVNSEFSSIAEKADKLQSELLFNYGSKIRLQNYAKGKNGIEEKIYENTK